MLTSNETAACARRQAVELCAHFRQAADDREANVFRLVDGDRRALVNSFSERHIHGDSLFLRQIPHLRADGATLDAAEVQVHTTGAGALLVRRSVLADAIRFAIALLGCVVVFFQRKKVFKEKTSVRQ